MEDQPNPSEGDKKILHVYPLVKVVWHIFWWNIVEIEEIVEIV